MYMGNSNQDLDYLVMPGQKKINKYKYLTKRRNNRVRAVVFLDPVYHRPACTLTLQFLTVVTTALRYLLRTTLDVY